MRVKIEYFPSGPFVTNAIVLSDSQGIAAIFDPAPGSLPELIRYIEENGLRVQKILLTHSHWDHIGDCQAAKDHFQVPVWIHKLDAPNLEQPGTDGLPMFLEIRGVKPDLHLEEGQIVEVGEIKLEVMHTPGHSPGSVCFYGADEQILIGGDLVFRGSIGNLALPTGQADHMWPSLDRIAKLPPETAIYPGHGEPTTVGNENWLAAAKEIFGGM